MHWTAKLAALAAAASIGATGAAVAVGHGGGTRTIVERGPALASPAASTSALSINDVYERARDAVVEIEVTSRSSGSGFGPFGDQTQEAQGSGFVVDSRGDIVTNDHVVEGATSISVIMADGTRYRATLVGRDPSTDVAVVRLSGSHPALDVLRFADSSKVRVGDAVIAIGTPFGLEETVTSGIVSALDRDIRSPNGSTISGAIQTDAAINSGNSGGPLLDASGDVIGINSQIEGNGGNDGIGFAVSSNTARSVARQLIAHGSIQHARLGVYVQDVTEQIAAATHEPVGAAIVKVQSGSAAARAGLHGATGTTSVAGQQVRTGGDVITAVDGSAIRSASDLQAQIEGRSPGDQVTLSVWHAGSTRSVRVTLGGGS